MAGSSNGRTPGCDPGNERFESSTRNHRKVVHSMKFFRLTSVFLCFALLSSFLSLTVSADDDMDYYSLSPVAGSEPSTASLYPVTPSATGDGWTSADSSRLRDIWQALTDSSSGNPGSIAYCVWWIWNYLKDDIRSALGSIQQNTLATASRILDSNSLLGSINNAVGGINGYATENTLSSFSSHVDNIFYPLVQAITDSYSDTNRYRIFIPVTGKKGYVSFGAYLEEMNRIFTSRATGLSNVTIFGMLQDLRDTLASEDDRQLAENYKENREQVEQDFLNGKSGKTSLGKDDFGSLSSVGGTFKDTISLNGQSSLSDLTSGLADADAAGQGWFSQATKDSLDAVSGSSSSESTVSTFSADGSYSVDVDPDPYHMQGFEDNYAWLWGDDDG